MTTMSEEMVVRSAKLFQVQFGRVPTKDDTDTSCLPQTQEETDWLVGLSDEDFDDLLAAWPRLSNRMGWSLSDYYNEMRAVQAKRRADKRRADKQAETQFCAECAEPLECTLCGSESTDEKMCTGCEEPTPTMACLNPDCTECTAPLAGEGENE